MTAGTPARPPASRWRQVQPVLSYVIAALCLLWVFHDVDWQALGRNLLAIQWVLVAPALVCDVLSYIAQGIRWGFLLRPVGRLSPLLATQAVYCGLFINEVAPLRAGEAARAFLVSRWLGADVVAIVPSMVVERLMDAVWLAAGIGLTAIFVTLPVRLQEAVDVFGLVVLALVGLFVFIVLRGSAAPGVTPPARAGWWRKVAGIFRRLGGGIRAIGLSWSLSAPFLVSLLQLLLQIAAFWLVMEACGLRVEGGPISPWAGAGVFLIVHLGTAIPNAPANVGSFQFFTVLGLSLFGVDKTAAASFSLVVFVLLTIPLWGIGSWALSRCGASWRSLRAEIGDLPEKDR